MTPLATTAIATFIQRTRFESGMPSASNGAGLGSAMPQPGQRVAKLSARFPHLPHSL